MAAQVPLMLKLVWSGVVCIVVFFYWGHYGPGNFVWFSDIALILSVVGLWLESPLLLSMQAISVLLFECIWTVDFMGRVFFGVTLIGVAQYMFNPELPLFMRSLSLFHLVLPILLPWAVLRLGYDSRALLWQTVFAWAVLLVSRLALPAEKNINWVFGPDPGAPLPFSYLVAAMVLLPVVVYWPTHLVFRYLAQARR